MSFVMVYSLFYLWEKVAEKVDIGDEKMLIKSLNLHFLNLWLDFPRKVLLFVLGVVMP